MAKHEVCVTVTFRFDPVEPDGSSCAICGDRIFLDQRRMVIIVGGQEMPQDVCICGSCYDPDLWTEAFAIDS